MNPVFDITDLSKHFGGVPALQGASLRLMPGEIHGLIGENGAGKSTLINIATGLFPADDGTMNLAGSSWRPQSPRHAREGGIAVVHQESELFPQLTLAENMLLGVGLPRTKTGLIDWSATFARAQNLGITLGESFNVRAPAGQMPVARRMMAEVAAAIAESATVLFLDEPTAALTQREIEQLFFHIRQLSDQGVAVVYISHRLEEVLQLCDRVTVLRDGATVASAPIAEWSLDSMVASMVGRDVSHLYQKPTITLGQPLLLVEHLTAKDAAFSDASLKLHSGEVLGVYGFVGAGRSELGQTLSGFRHSISGTVSIDQTRIPISTPGRALRAGIAYLPEDRLLQGVFRGHSVRTNASIAMLRNLSIAGWVRQRKERTLAEQVVSETNVRTTSIEQSIGSLSGGNQQKVVFGRWRAAQPKVMILDEPTRGVDVAAKTEIHRLITREAERGAGIILISSELPEIMAMSDRVLTMAEGRVTGIFDPAQGEEAIAAAAVPGSTAAMTEPPSKPKFSWRRYLHFREAGLLIFILLLATIMSALKPEEFANVGNFLDILANAALPAIMALGVMLVIATGGIDISLGSMMALSGALAAMTAKAGYPPLMCLAVGVGAGTSISLLNGGLSLAARIHPIIITLAGISVYRGIMQFITGGYEIIELPASYRALADGPLFGAPKICWYVLAVTLGVHVLLRRTMTGRQLLALGDSPTAAHLLGLPRVRLTLFAFAVSGALTGLTAVLHAGYYGKVQSNTGVGWELQAIAAAVIGGTNILGGRASALGTLLGAFLVALLCNALILLDASAYYQHIFVGGLILLAVTTDALTRQMQRGRAL